MIITKQSREYPSQKMDIASCHHQLINRFISMISKACSIRKKTISTSMEIFGLIKRRKRFNHLLNIWANSFSVMLTTLHNKMNSRLLVRLCKSGLMKELSPSINCSGMLIRYWKSNTTLQIQIFYADPASTDRYWYMIWEDKLPCKR